MKILHKSTSTVILSIFFLACSSEDENQIGSLENEKFIKSRIYTNLPPNTPNYDEFYTYENNFLKTASGFTNFLGDYSYDSDGKLTSLVNQSEQFTYEYDTNERIIRQNEVGTNNYIELFYYNDRVITNRYYEFGAINGIPNSRLEERELLIDSQGRITKMTDLTPEESAINTLYEIYEYDDNGNIIKVTSKESNKDAERIINYEYENIKNSFHNAFKNYYEKTYYLEFFLGLQVHNWSGITPNLIKSGNRTYETETSGYPIKEYSRQSSGDIFEIVYEYY